LLNTCFFPTIERYMSSDVQFKGQMDTSLLEVMLENLLGLDDTDITLADDANDVSATVDYLSTRSSITLSINEELCSKGLADMYYCPADPMLKISTPPPKA